MTFSVNVEFDASSKFAATKIITNLSRISDIAHRDHPDMCPTCFDTVNETKSKLVFTELYGNEQAFLEHSSDVALIELYKQAFDHITRTSEKQLYSKRHRKSIITNKRKYTP